MPVPPPPVPLPGIFKPAHHWLKLLRERRIGAVELLNLHLMQLDRYNGRIQAVVAKDLESALGTAWSADNTAPSQRQPLHGLPMTVNDTFEVIGMPAACGRQALAHEHPQRDADAVARLRGAGAVIYGKSHTSPSTMAWPSSDLVRGPPHNPWDLNRSPGGSSGGSAAAVACGFSPLELGSDVDGDLCVTALFCGIYGHTPSAGLVPLRGHRSPLPGPMARSAADLELALDVLVTPPDPQRTVRPIRVRPSRHEHLRDFRVALWADDHTFAVDTECLAAVHAWADELRRLGIPVNRKARPSIDWHAAFDAYRMTMPPNGAVGGTPSVIDSLEGRAQREALFRHWRAFFVHHDLLICPTSSTVAYPHDPRGGGRADLIATADGRRTRVGSMPGPYGDSLQWPSMASVSDLPATAIPIGRLVRGMPMGVQVIGPPLEDRTPIRFAQLLEDAVGGIRLAPCFT